MSKIEQLIQQYCPDGVEYFSLNELFEMRNGYTPSTTNKDYWDDGIIPWFKMEDIRSHGNVLSDSYIHITPRAVKGKGLFNANSIIIATSATIGEHALVLVEHLSNQRFTNLYPHKRFEDRINMLFMNYYFDIVDDWCKSHTNQSSFASVDMKQLRNLLIPLPPLPVQEEIAKILDTFSELQTELQSELQTELQARRQQYQYYRDKLLSFEGRGDVEWKKLGDIGNQWYRGSGIKRDEVTELGIPCIRYGEIHTTYNIWFDNCVSHTDANKQTSKKYADYGDILFAITSEDIPFVGNSVAYLGKERILVGGDIVVMKHSQNPKYLSYALSTSDAVRQKGKGKVKSKVVHTNVPSLKEIEIPIPSLEEQERIASTLDRFDALVNDLSQGLPAEIEARKQQYEYYRDKLLTFKKKA